MNAWMHERMGKYMHACTNGCMDDLPVPMSAVRRDEA